jgi:hypothetical protein
MDSVSKAEDVVGWSESEVLCEGVDGSVEVL